MKKAQNSTLSNSILICFIIVWGLFRLIMEKQNSPAEEVLCTVYIRLFFPCDILNLQNWEANGVYLKFSFKNSPTYRFVLPFVVLPYILFCYL